MRGVQLGSKLVALNDTMVLTRSYLDTLDMVKTMPRPLKVVMEKVLTHKLELREITYLMYTESQRNSLVITISK